MANSLITYPEHDNSSGSKRARSLIYLAIIFVAVAALLLPRLSPELAVSKAVSPGPLSNAHAEYENKCFECHRPFSDEGRSNLCIGCHEQVKEDMHNSRGFHGRWPSVTAKPCESCHSEHTGRQASITSLDERIFDHDFTDFRLAGAHAGASVGCDACHEKDKKFRDAPSDCYICHMEDDTHNKRLGTQCAVCHKETSWDDIYFSHGQTCFPLEGKHRNVACDRCHPDKTYSNVSSSCNACHLVNDIHDSKLEEKCDNCHGNEDWKKVTFDHNLETDFVLKNRHAEIGCGACHPGLKFLESPGTECADCHKKDDVHKGRNGLACDDCHSLVEWGRVTFDHNKNTGFGLSGRHAEAQCISCHKENPREEKPAATCHSCHRADDVHMDQLGLECDSCHNTGGWKEHITFDHDLTPFPLIGFHAFISCGECHLSFAFKETSKTCVSCHESDDYHQRTLGPECGDCHNPNGWRLWQFDHNLQTRFKLEGAHEELKCKACHGTKAKEKAGPGRTCYACHSDDDVHFRKFGKQCERCHVVRSFQQIITKE